MGVDGVRRRYDTVTVDSTEDGTGPGTNGIIDVLLHHFFSILTFNFLIINSLIFTTFSQKIRHDTDHCPCSLFLSLRSLSSTSPNVVNAGFGQPPPPRAFLLATWHRSSSACTICVVDAPVGCLASTPCHHRVQLIPVQYRQFSLRLLRTWSPHLLCRRSLCSRHHHRQPLHRFPFPTPRAPR